MSDIENTPVPVGSDRLDYDDDVGTSTRGNGWVVFACVLLSALLWLAFSLRRPTTVSLSLPTRLVNLPANESLLEAPPDTVEYVVSGEAIAVLPVYYNRPVVEIDAAMDDIDFELGGAAFPVDVRVEAASPRHYSPRREPRVSTRVPIELRATISVPPTHAFTTQPFIEPDSVVISGAQSVVEGIRSWPTETIRLDDVTEPVRVTLALRDSLGGIVSIAGARTTLVADVAEFTQGTRDIDVRLTGGATNQPPATLSPARISVSFRVSIEDYKAAIASPSFYATVPYDQIRFDTTGRVVPTVNVPQGLEIKDIVMSPPAVRYFNVLYDQ